MVLWTFVLSKPLSLACIVCFKELAGHCQLRCSVLRKDLCKSEDKERYIPDHRGPDAVSPRKCTRSPSETGDLEQFHGKSACGLVKILRCAQDDSVGAWIGVILMGAAVRLHARSARRWALWGRARKGWFSGTGVHRSSPELPIWCDTQLGATTDGVPLVFSSRVRTSPSGLNSIMYLSIDR